MMKKIILSLLAITTLSGCATNQIGARSYLDVNKTTGEAQPGSRVFIWNSDYSAGIGNSNGQCAQGALTATASSLGAALDVVGKAKGGLDYSEAVQALHVSTVQTSYANLGYFYLCQIALNDHAGGKKLSPSDIKEMFLDVGKTASKLKGAGGKTSSTISPKQASALQALFQSKADSGSPPPTEQEVEKVLEENESASNNQSSVTSLDVVDGKVTVMATQKQADALRTLYDTKAAANGPAPTKEEVQQVLNANKSASDEGSTERREYILDVSA